jgi:hypothetical protein
MTQKLYVNLGRLGDCLNLLPLLYADFKAGARSAFLTCKDYVDTLKGCSYLDAYSFDGTPDQIDKAMEYAGTLGKQVVCCQTAGPLDLIQKYAYGPAGMPHAKEESFQKTAWKMAGREKDWKLQTPLVFDQRSPEREAALVKGWDSKKRHILVHADGKSSPFPCKELLFTLLRLRFKKGYEIHDLSEVKAERFYDILGLYEKAYVLIAVDSAPLHLAYACPKLPVIAFVNDRPNLWNGSCWRPNHVLHIRYGDCATRITELLDVIPDIGHPGCRFNPTVKSPKIVHVWSRYELNQANKERHLKARETWKAAYHDNRWVETPIEVGAIGRDTLTSIRGEKARYCYLKDSFRLACLRADDNDLICLTRPDTCLCVNITELLLNNPLSYSHRTVTENGQLNWHPMVDLFCMPKTWWQAHQNELPDLVLGNDIFWQRALAELLKMHGAVELPFAIYRDAAKKEAE